MLELPPLGPVVRLREPHDIVRVPTARAEELVELFRFDVGILASPPGCRRERSGGLAESILQNYRGVYVEWRYRCSISRLGSRRERMN
jgi:hypothetical protein